MGLPGTVGVPPAKSGRDARGPRRQWGILVALAVGRIAFGFQFQSVAALGPELTRVFQLDYASLGTLIGIYMAPGMFVAVPGGLLGRRFGERWVVAAGFVLMSAGAALAATATSPGGIGAGRLVAGLGAVLLIVLQGKMVSDRFHGQGFIMAMGMLVGTFPVGVGLAGLALGPVVRLAGWPGMFAVGGGLAALSFGLILFCSDVPRTPGSTWRMPSRPECLLVAVAGLVWTAYNAGYYGFLSYMPSLLALHGHPPALTALVLTLSTWLNLPGTLLGGWLAGRFGTGRVFVVGTAASFVAVAGPAVLDSPLVWALLFGTVASLQAGVIVAMGTLSARPENRAVGMGLFYTVYYAGGTAIPALCGVAADRAGTPAAALIAAAAIGALALPLYALHRRMAAPA